MQTEITKMVDDYDRGRLSRRQLITHLAGLAAIAGVAGPGARVARAAPPADPTFTGTDVNHIALRVTDIPRSRDFYRKHLGLTVTSEGESNCFLRCNEKNFVALFKNEKAGMDHYCYSVAKYEPADAVARLEKAGLGPRRRGDRVYFDDPDGLEVQVAAKTHTV